jgi:hypothetical protein
MSLKFELSSFPSRTWIARRNSTRRRWASGWTLTIAPQSTRRRWASGTAAKRAIASCS